MNLKEIVNYDQDCEQPLNRFILEAQLGYIKRYVTKDTKELEINGLCAKPIILYIGEDKNITNNSGKTEFMCNKDISLVSLLEALNILLSHKTSDVFPILRENEDNLKNLYLAIYDTALTVLDKNRIEKILTILD